MKKAFDSDTGYGQAFGQLTVDVIGLGAGLGAGLRARRGNSSSKQASMGKAAPYDARQWREHLEAKLGSDNVSSTTVPASNKPNVKLAGKRHPTTGVVFDGRGFPIFDDVAVFVTRIGKADIAKSEPSQMSASTKSLDAAINCTHSPRPVLTSPIRS